MYTLEDLKKKSLAELKEIGWELNVLPKDDRRKRQSWIDALVNVNPPLLQLLEVSPGAEVEQVQEAIEQAVENPPDFYVEELIQEPLAESTPGATDCPFCDATHALFTTKDHLERTVIRCLHCQYSRPKNYPGAIQTLAQESKSGLAFYPCPAQPPNARIAKTSPETPKFQVGDLVQSKTMVWGIERKSMTGTVLELLPRGGVRVQFGNHVSGYGGSFDFSSQHLEDLIPVQEPIEVQSQDLLVLESSTAEVEQVQGAIGKTVEFSANVELQAQESIASAAKNSLNPKSDQNPILTGIVLSDRFLARFSPPQSEFLHYEISDGYKVDTDGQLRLFEAQVVTEPEPPDPDDFESLDAFREAIARWDAQNPEPLAVSMDSMCEWAPCPEDWYEPKTEILPLKASSMMEVMELLQAGESSITSDFFIPTFDRGDLSDGDEPPDTWNFARLPKPKPPKFPSQAASWTQVGHKLDTSQLKSAQVSSSQIQSTRHPETIPKLFHCVVAGATTQPARSPPGGDAA